MFTIAKVMSYGSQEDTNVYPSIDKHGVLVKEDLDGGELYNVPCAGFSVERKMDGEFKSILVSGSFSGMTITDSRIILRCERFNKGIERDAGNAELIFGPAILSHLLDFFFSIKKMMATMKSELIGHLRYEWIASVGYFKPTSAMSRPYLRLVYFDDEKKCCYVDITLLSGVPVELVANECLKRVARYRLRMTDIHSSQNEKILRNCAEGRQTIQKDKNPENVSMFTLPDFYSFPNGSSNKPDSDSKYISDKAHIDALMKRADQGDVEAQMEVAYYYCDSDGVPLDVELTNKYFKMAAEAGNADAQHNYGLSFWRGQKVPDYKQALYWTQKSAQKNNAHAINSLGVFYEFGRGVEKDYAKAAEYYLEACEKGSEYIDGTPYYNLAKLYLDGKCSDANSREIAIKLLQKAVDKGYEKARAKLAELTDPTAHT